MTVDFADHFWGEKNNGFSVLYQSMKHGQANVKELVAFLRERATAEEEYQKRLTLITKQVSTFGTVGTFAPVWQMVRASLEKISSQHSHLVQKLHDLSKEVQKYGDDQQKVHKEVKEKESKTFDAVNYIQTTTTCLQKARENYFARCIEHEKLKRENANAKEVSKSETRMKKAAEEYKLYVDKYGKVRDDFEDRMIKAARSFQQSEENHLSQMKLFASAYAQNIQTSYVLVNQVYGDFLDQMTALDIDLLLNEFIGKKDTGTEKPLFYFFEEPDLSSLPQQPGSTTAVNSLEVATSLMGPDAASSGSVGAISSAESSPIPGGGGGGGGRSNTPPAMADMFFDANSTVIPSNQQQQQQQQKKLSLWLPGRKQKANSTSGLKNSNSGGGSTVVTPSPSTDMAGGTTTNLFTGGASSNATTPAGFDGGKLEGDSLSDNKHPQLGGHQSLSATQSASLYSGTTAANHNVSSGPPSATLPSSSYTLFGTFPPDESAAAAAQQQQQQQQAQTLAQQKRRDRSLSMGFLRKKKEKKKKDKENDNGSVRSSEDTRSKTSAESGEATTGALVDREGFSIIPEDQNHMRDRDGSSSESDSEDDQPQKIKVEIKPISQDMLHKSSASIDELRDAIGNMSVTSGPGTLRGWSTANARRSGEDVSMDFFDPMSSRNHTNANTSDPWGKSSGLGGNRTDAKLLRPAKTGDDRYNNRSFAGGVHFAADTFVAPMLPPRHAPPPVPTSTGGAEGASGDSWPTTHHDESRDQVADLSSTSSVLQHSISGQWPGGGGATVGGVSRNRPRSTTPTHMITLANATAGGIGGVKRGSVSSRSTSSSQFESNNQLAHSESFGSLDQPPSSQLTGSRGPSPLAVLGPSDAVPLAMALTETVHVVFNKTPGGESRCVARVIGNIAVSFPSTVVNALAASLFSPTTVGQRPPLSFQLTNADKIAALVPNPQVLNQGSTFQAGSSHQFECNMPALIAQLKRQVDAQPSAAFCNLDLVRYELKSAQSEGGSTNNNLNGGAMKLVPLVLQSFWKCEADHTDIRVDYQYNAQSTVSAPLLNLTFASEVNGGVTQVNSKPEAAWSSSNNRLSWRLTELSRHGESSGSLKARANLTNGPSTPSPTNVQFQINEHILSGADLQLINNNSSSSTTEEGIGAYRLSLLKKKTISGKYSCESELR